MYKGATMSGAKDITRSILIMMEQWVAKNTMATPIEMLTELAYQTGIHEGCRKSKEIQNTWGHDIKKQMTEEQFRKDLNNCLPRRFIITDTSLPTLTVTHGGDIRDNFHINGDRHINYTAGLAQNEGC